MSNEFSKVVYPELSYKINGVLYKVHNELGRFCNEKQYGDFIEKSLKENNIEYEREKILSESFDGEHKGRNKLDFIIEKIFRSIKFKISNACEF